MLTGRATVAALFSLAVSGAIGGPTAQAAVLPSASGNVSILGPGDATIVDAATLWNTSSAAGDVNGDGVDDLALYGVDQQAGFFVPLARIVYGAASPAIASRAAAAARGWTFTAPAAHPGREIVAAGVGDLDADGYDDVVGVVSEPDVYTPTPNDTIATLLRGSAAAGRTSQLGEGGPGTTQLIAPRGSKENFRRSVERLGDVNGDGFGDFVVVWPGSSGFRLHGTVLFGGATWPATIDLEAPGARGFLIRGGDESLLPVVRSAGDVNGDGKDDVLVRHRQRAGVQLSTAVILGSTATAPVDLSTASLAPRGFRINLTRDAFPWGDLDRDGRDDLLVLGTSANAANRSFVIKGRAATTDLTLGAGYQTLLMEFRDARPAGDVNGDGRPDLVGDLPFRSGTNGGASPHSALVFGPASTAANATINLSSATANPAAGVRFFGDDLLENRRTEVNAAGDFNGDGHADLVARVGRASYETPETTHRVFFGFGAGQPAPIDTTAPLITNWFTGKDTFYGTCGFFGQRYTDGIGMSFTSNEEGTFDVTTTGTGGTRTGTVKFGLGPQNVFLPASFAPRTAHTRTVTVVPVDAAGNRGTALTGTTEIKAGAWRWAC